MNISNKTKRPLRLPLPGGKTLFLGPGKTAQVTPKAKVHPPLVALAEAGDVEFQDESASTRNASDGRAGGVSSSEAHAAGSGARRTGDR